MKIYKKMNTVFIIKPFILAVIYSLLLKYNNLTDNFISDNFPPDEKKIR